jgi:hypothetical protein
MRTNAPKIDEVVGILTGNLEKIAEHGRRPAGIVTSMLARSRGAISLEPYRLVRSVARTVAATEQRRSKSPLLGVVAMAIKGQLRAIPAGR